MLRILLYFPWAKIVAANTMRRERGPVDTPMLQGNDNFDEQDSLPPGLPIRRRAKPQEIARTVAFLLGDESTYTTGSAYTVDGGWQC